MNAREGMRRVVNAIIAAIHEGGPAPESAIHLALQTMGATYAQSCDVINAMVNAGILRRENNLIHLIPPDEGDDQ